MLAPFTIPDFGYDEEPDEQPHDLGTLNFAASPVNTSNDVPETEHLTAEDRLTQEIAAFSQQDTHEDTLSNVDDLPEESSIDTYSHNEEADTLDNMPEDSLLTDNNAAPEIEDDDDFDMSSFGDAASIYDEDTDTPHEEFTTPEPEPEPEPEEITPSASFIPDAGEQKEKQKTMGIRDKLKAKKDGASSGKAGLFTNILLILLLIVGGLLLWQLYGISDKLTLLSMNAGASFTSAPSTTSAPEVYEYAIDFILDSNINERMAARGRDGWQVVGSRRTVDATNGQYGYELIFMRKLTGR